MPGFRYYNCVFEQPGCHIFFLFSQRVKETKDFATKGSDMVTPSDGPSCNSSIPPQLAHRKQPRMLRTLQFAWMILQCCILHRMYVYRKRKKKVFLSLSCSYRRTYAVHELTSRLSYRSIDRVLVFLLSNSKEI